MIHLAKNFELWPVDRLKPYERNARTHSPEQVAKICASMIEFGFTSPILVDSKDGIIAGHGRLLAAKDLGLAEVPVIVLDHLTDQQRRAYIIADNKLSDGSGWDDDLLAVELAELEDDGFDLELTGFSDDELADLLGDGAEDFAPQPLAGDEQGPDSGDTQPDDSDQTGTMFQFGEFRFSVTRDEYLSCVEDIRQSVGFDRSSVIGELRRRLGL